VSRLIVIVVLAAVVSASGVSVITWIVAQTTPVSGLGTAAMNSSSDEEQRRHREQFFGGDPNRDIRGGQEMKPRW
jgi:type IV secretion system protein TrbK